MVTDRNIQKPKLRSAIRLKIGRFYYGLMRHVYWIKLKDDLASEQSATQLPFNCFAHKSLLLRQLKDVDMWMQYNKITNLKIAIEKMNGIIIHPNEVFSYWKLIGRPTKRKGYVEGMVLHNGTFSSGIGGGLCQLSNLIFWMTIHTPLTVIERHRHGYDVFPDANRTQPFGSGATCFYPYGDLMIRNDTNDDYQLNMHVGDEYLEGIWCSSAQSPYRYEIVEKNHEMKRTYWGGYSRHNELYKQTIDRDGCVIDEACIIKNSAIMMYPPFLANPFSESD